MDDRLTVTLNSDAANDGSDGLERLAGLVETFVAQAGLPTDIAFRLNLCFDELIANTWAYGAPGGRTPVIRPTIQVDVALENGAIRARIEDDAAPHDPFADAPAPDLKGSIEDRPIGGLGLHLVHRFADDVSYCRDGGHNVVALTLRIS